MDCVKAKKTKKNIMLGATVFALLNVPGVVSAEMDDDSDRVAYLEEQVKQLTGDLEEARHDLKLMKETVKVLQENAVAAPPAAPVATRDKDVRAPSDADETGEKHDAAHEDDTSVHELPTGTAQEAYDHAVSLIHKQREYQKAEAALTHFIKKYPKHRLVVNAQYWIGETHLLRREYKKAALYFARAYKTYKGDVEAGKSSDGKQQSFAKAPEALIKLAMSLKGLGKRDEASATLRQLHKEFPHLPTNLKHLAERAQNGL